MWRSLWTSARRTAARLPLRSASRWRLDGSVERATADGALRGFVPTMVASSLIENAASLSCDAYKVGKLIDLGSNAGERLL